MPSTLAQSLTVDNYLKYFLFAFPCLNKKSIRFLVIVLINMLLRSGMLKHHILIMPYLELCITTKCSLRCKHCANFIPHYGKGENLSLDEIFIPLTKLLNAVDFISNFRILGGEPFLHPFLPEIIEFCMSNRKFDHVEIVTNGTILPSDNILATLKKYQVVVYISNYGDVVKNRNRLIQLLKKNNIAFLFDSSFWWEDLGVGTKFTYSLNEVKNIYKNCNMICKTLFHAELHVCPRSSHGTDLGFVKKYHKDFVDILSFSSKKSLRKAIFEFYEKDYIEACYHCLAAPKKIRAGEQISFSEKIL